MLSIYGIMARRCGDCNFQFLTTLSYDHHKQNRRCDIYKEIEMPSKEKQLEIINSMRNRLVRTTLDNENNLISPQPVSEPDGEVDLSVRQEGNGSGPDETDKTGIEKDQPDTTDSNDVVEKSNEVITENGIGEKDSTIDHETSPKASGDDVQDSTDVSPTEPEDKDSPEPDTTELKRNSDDMGDNDEVTQTSVDKPEDAEDVVPPHLHAENDDHQDTNDESTHELENDKISEESKDVSDNDADKEDKAVEDNPEENPEDNLEKNLEENPEENPEEEINNELDDDRVYDPAATNDQNSPANDNNSLPDEALDIPDEPGSSEADPLTQTDKNTICELIADPTLPCNESPEKPVISNHQLSDSDKDSNQNQNCNTTSGQTNLLTEFLNSPLAADVFRSDAAELNMPDLTEIESYLNNERNDLSPHHSPVRDN